MTLPVSATSTVDLITPITFFSVHHFFPVGTVLGHHLFFRITEQGVGEFVLGNKCLVPLLAIRRDANDRRIEGLDLFPQTAESLGLLGSARGVILGVEINDHLLATQPPESDLLAVLVRKREQRCCLAFDNSHEYSVPGVNFPHCK